MSKRTKSYQRKMPQLMMEFRGKCAYCGVDVIPVKRCRRNGSYVRETPHFIHFEVGGEILMRRKASIDHIQRIADGGGHALGNLLLSCVACNNNRDKPNHPRVEHNKLCRRCGKQNDRRPRYCKECVREMTAEYFRSIR